MLKNTLKNLVLALMLMLLTSANTAIARQALSWNLSRDLILTGMATNPKGVWAFMQNVPGNTNPTKYTLLPKYLAPCDLSFWGNTANPDFVCWEDIKSNSVIGVAEDGILDLHPGANNQVILRWTSPVVGNIGISGRISAVNPACGDGANWYLRTQFNVLQSGVLAKGQGATFNIQILPVTKAQKIYFVIDKKANNFCDSTNLDMLITYQTPK
jgi:hypothetical protein